MVRRLRRLITASTTVAVLTLAAAPSAAAAPLRAMCPGPTICSSGGTQTRSSSPLVRHVLPHSNNPRWRELGYNPRWPASGHNPKWQNFGHNPRWAASSAHQLCALGEPTRCGAPTRPAG